MWCIKSEFKMFKLKKTAQQTQAMFVAGKNGSRLGKKATGGKKKRKLD